MKRYAVAVRKVVVFKLPALQKFQVKLKRMTLSQMPDQGVLGQNSTKAETTSPFISVVQVLR